MILSLMAGAAVGDIAYVTNQNSNDLSVIDLDTRAEIRRIPVPGGPAGVQVASHLQAVFTVSPNDKTLRRFDIQSGKMTGQIELDGGPIGIAQSDTHIFVSDWFNARIWIIDAENMAIIGTLETGAAPAGLAVSNDGHWLVSADRDADALSVFDLTTQRQHTRIRVGTRPFAVSFDQQGRVYSTNVGSDTVTIADPETGQTITTLQTGSRPYGVAFAKGHIFVSNQYGDTISVYDYHTYEPQHIIEVGEYPEGINATANEDHVVVANWFSNTLTVIDAVSFTIKAEVTTGDGPRAFGQFILPTEGQK